MTRRSQMQTDLAKAREQLHAATQTNAELAALTVDLRAQLEAAAPPSEEGPLSPERIGEMATLLQWQADMEVVATAIKEQATQLAQAKVALSLAPYGGIKEGARQLHTAIDRHSAYVRVLTELRVALESKTPLAVSRLEVVKAGKVISPVGTGGDGDADGDPAA